MLLQNKLLKFISGFRHQLELVITPVSTIEDEAAGYKPRYIEFNCLRPNQALQTWSSRHNSIDECFPLSEEELVIITHEFGHFISDLNGFHTNDYQNALNDFFDNSNPSPTSIKLVIKEEEMAWENAEELLIKRMGHTDLTIFKQTKIKGLNSYYSINQAA